MNEIDLYPARKLEKMTRQRCKHGTLKVSCSRVDFQVSTSHEILVAGRRFRERTQMEALDVPGISGSVPRTHGTFFEVCGDGRVFSCDESQQTGQDGQLHFSAFNGSLHDMNESLSSSFIGLITR
jgi:hypothetical protein